MAMYVPNRQDRHGRSKWPNGHCAVLPCVVLKSAAFRNLGGSSVRILVELMTRDFGNNNGDISLSLDEAARLLSISKSTALSAFRDLVAKGILVKTSPGSFVRGHAATWRITFKAAGGKPSTNEWKFFVGPEARRRSRRPWGNRKRELAEVHLGVKTKIFSGTPSERKQTDTVL
jgi:hypothetical protein